MNNSERLSSLARFLPPLLFRELLALRRCMRGEVRELRLRSSGISSVIIDGATYPLYTRLDGGMLEEITGLLCHGSLYAYRDSIAAGFLPAPFGVRVAVAGEARYDGGRLVGIDRISSLVFRIPGDRCDFADGLYRGWLELGCRNMLICAPPLCGKTSALRSLAGLIGSGRDARRVVVVDERLEFDESDYRGATVDILRGYRRSTGTELAVRLLSPEVILVDEIASRSDAAAVRSAVGVGIPVIATVHGGDIGDLMRRDFIAELIRDGCFELFTVITADGGEFRASAVRKIAV